MFINEALAIIIEEHGVEDQHEMAEILGTSQATVSNYMKGGMDPRKVVAARIWGRYGMQVEPYTEESLQLEWDFLVAHKLDGEPK